MLPLNYHFISTPIEVLRSFINKTCAQLSLFNSFLMALEPQPVVSVTLLHLPLFAFMHPENQQPTIGTRSNAPLHTREPFNAFVGLLCIVGKWRVRAGVRARWSCLFEVVREGRRGDWILSFKENPTDLREDQHLKRRHLLLGEVHKVCQTAASLPLCSTELFLYPAWGCTRTPQTSRC